MAVPVRDTVGASRRGPSSSISSAMSRFAASGSGHGVVGAFTPDAVLLSNGRRYLGSRWMHVVRLPNVVFT